MEICSCSPPRWPQPYFIFPDPSGMSGGPSSHQLRERLRPQRTAVMMLPFLAALAFLKWLCWFKYRRIYVELHRENTELQTTIIHHEYLCSRFLCSSFTLFLLFCKYLSDLNCGLLRVGIFLPVCYRMHRSPPARVIWQNSPFFMSYFTVSVPRYRDESVKCSSTKPHAPLDK